jgi:hypothetical protein
MPKLIWKKCPAVWTGGKEWFYVARKSEIFPNNEVLWWVCWNRFKEKWALTNREESVREYYDSDKKAKEAAEKREEAMEKT